MPDDRRCNHEVEIDKLRAQLAAERAAHADTLAMLDAERGAHEGTLTSLIAERAAHAETKAQLDAIAAALLAKVPGRRFGYSPTRLAAEAKQLREERAAHAKTLREYQAYCDTARKAATAEAKLREERDAYKAWWEATRPRERPTRHGIDCARTIANGAPCRCMKERDEAMAIARARVEALPK